MICGTRMCLLRVTTTTNLERLHKVVWQSRPHAQETRRVKMKLHIFQVLHLSFSFSYLFLLLYCLFFSLLSSYSHTSSHTETNKHTHTLIRLYLSASLTQPLVLLLHYGNSHVLLCIYFIPTITSVHYTLQYTQYIWDICLLSVGKRK